VFSLATKFRQSF